tara:strand:+ start:431 stop:877 length:447 start_codon:yes stop_codon:yes gene_type:complete
MSESQCQLYIRLVDYAPCHFGRGILYPLFWKVKIMTTTTNIVNVMHSEHRILIDRVEAKRPDRSINLPPTVIAWVITPTLKPLRFYVSPFETDADIETMARAWIDYGCPVRRLHVPKERWTKEDLIKQGEVKATFGNYERTIRYILGK